MNAEKIKELKDFHAAALRCREVPYRMPEAQEAYRVQFDRVLDVLLPALLTDGESLLEENQKLKDEVEALTADAERYRWLRDSQNCSLSINHNDHHCVYESVEQTFYNFAGDPKADYYADVPADERAKMIATDTIWTLHIYPNTPVGFNVYHAATLDAAIDAARHEPTKSPQDLKDAER
jgi:hypothetical protein